MCFFLNDMSEKFLVLKTIQLDAIGNTIRSCVKYPLFLSDFNAALIFKRFSKNLQISDLTHIQWKPKRSMRKDGGANT